MNTPTKTKILNTKQGIIVKVPHLLADFDGAIRRARAKTHSPMVHLGSDGDCAIYATRGYYDLRSRRRMRFQDSPCEDARRLQSRAEKVANKFVEVNNRGGWTEACGTSAPSPFRARLAARYALSPEKYLAGFPTPKLP